MRKCLSCGHHNEDAAVSCSECGEELETAPTPETDAPLRDPALSLVVVATFSNLPEASVLAGRLEAAGIEACIPEEYGPQVFSEVIPLEHITVRVAAKDYETAKAVLAQPPPETGTTDPV